MFKHLTKFIKIIQLRRLKGSDASGRHDIEVDEGQQEFSDDEEERKVRKAKKGQKKPDDAQNLNDAKRWKIVDYFFKNVSNSFGEKGVEVWEEDMYEKGWEKQ